MCCLHVSPRNLGCHNDHDYSCLANSAPVLMNSEKLVTAGKGKAGAGKGKAKAASGKTL